MIRFIALAWDEPREPGTADELVERLSTAQGAWQEVLHCNGLRVFCSGLIASELCRLTGNDGVVLGALFERKEAPGFAHCARLGSEDSARIIKSGGHELITRYFGRYIAFLSDGRNAKRCVLRDPLGGVPCFQTRSNGVTVFFSTLADCAAVGIHHCDINYDYLRRRLTFDKIRTPATALAEVTELQPGECAIFQHGRASKIFYWDPRKIALEPITDAEYARQQLRDTALMCIRAWLGYYENVLLRLSGGLDSSIVLGCMRNAPFDAQIDSVLYYTTEGTHTDSRGFARLAAEGATRRHVEIDRTTLTMDFSALLSLTPTPKPFAHLGNLELATRELPLMRDCGANAVFSGDFGDALFGHLGTRYLLTDAFYQRWPPRQTLDLAHSIVSPSQLPLWKLLARAGNDVMRGHVQPDELDVPRHFVSAAVIDGMLRAPRVTHPWFEPMKGIPPGKALHIQAMHGCDDLAYQPSDGGRMLELIAPLCSQPLVELCLRIPVYLLALHGVDRGLAREAFAPLIPREIAQRTWKGRPGTVLQRQLLAQRDLLRSILLEGTLVREGLLDKTKIEDYFRGRDTGGYRVMELFQHLLCEVCLHSLRHSAAPRAIDRAQRAL